MTSPPSPPNRRRRRIVVGVAVLVLAVGWWVWPRVDQRFVGRWYFTTRQTGEKRRAIEFHPDGRTTVFLSDGTPASNHAQARWWSEGETLVIQYVNNSRWRQLQMDALILMMRLRRLPEPWDIERHQIVEQGSDHLRLRFIPHPGETPSAHDWLLFRLPLK